MLVTVTGCTDLERRLASLDFSKKGSGKSAGGSSFLFAVLSCARSRPLYRRRPRRPSGKSNNATCRFRLIYSRYPLEGPSTCKARVVICSHLERIGLRSPRSRKSLSRRASSTPSPLPSSSSLPSSPSPPPILLPKLSALFSLRYFASSVDATPPSRLDVSEPRGEKRTSFQPCHLSSVRAFYPLLLQAEVMSVQVKVNRISNRLDKRFSFL